MMRRLFEASLGVLPLSVPCLLAWVLVDLTCPIYVVPFCVCVCLSVDMLYVVCFYRILFLFFLCPPVA